MKFYNNSHIYELNFRSNLRCTNMNDMWRDEIVMRGVSV